MHHFGVELVTASGLYMFEGDMFHLSMVWGANKIGHGKDAYQSTGIILPEKRVAATGRIGHLSMQSLSSLEADPCCPVLQRKENPFPFKVEVCLPNRLFEWLKRDAYFVFVKKKERESKETLVYFPPDSIEKIAEATYHIDLTETIQKHL